MIFNFHTHTTFCDGKNTPEDIVVYALEKGVTELGFSGHAYTDFDLKFCMKDVQDYIVEVNRLKEKYKKDIQIFLGVEEDMYTRVNRADYDYIIGSAHYLCVDKKYYPVVDPNYETFQTCLALFDDDIERFAEAYYKEFCNYILQRKPEIIGHFDYITKYEETKKLGMIENTKYRKIAEKYISKAAESGCIFEVNLRAVSKGMRTSPYPHETLLYLLRTLGARVTISTDTHEKEMLDFKFEDTKSLLKDIGFQYIYTLNGAVKL